MREDVGFWRRTGWAVADLLGWLWKVAAALLVIGFLIATYIGPNG